MLAPLAANMSPYRFPPCATSVSTLRNDRRAPCRVAATASLGRHRSGKSVTKRLTFSGVTPSRSYRLWRHFPRFCDLLTRALRPYRVPTLRACGEQTRPNGRRLPDAMLLGLHPGERNPSTRREDDFRCFRYLFGSSSGSSFDSPFGSSSDSPSAPPSPPPVNRK